MTPRELSELDDDGFFAYLAALDRWPDAPAQVLADAWLELQKRRRRLDDALYADATAAGMTPAQVDQLRRSPCHDLAMILIPLMDRTGH